jgi:transcriptional regulator with XRE-family HTH domain
MSITGEEICRIRKTFGWSGDQFARLLGVHPVTLSRWEAAKAKEPKIEGMALTILLGLRERVLNAPAEQRLLPEEARRTASDIERLLVVGGVLVALGVLLACINKDRR